MSDRTLTLPQPAVVAGVGARRSETPLRSHLGWLLAAVWLLSRGIMAAVWTAKAQFIAYDVQYYFTELGSAGRPGGDALIEYPAPIVWLLEVMRWLSGPDISAFTYCFVLAMFALDAVTTVILWQQSQAAASYWTAFIFAIGSLIWFRIDLIPAAAVALSLFWFARRPAASGMAMAVGAATKLWPALLILPLLGLDRRSLKRAIGFLLAGGGLGLASLLATGWTRSISPLTWQSDRGLQVEAVVASLPMARQAFGEKGYRIFLSKYNAWEIAGPGVQGWIDLSDALLFACVALTLLLTWLISFGGVGLPGHSLAAVQRPDRRDVRRHAGILAVVALICFVIIANKTFSPQYIIWLSGPLAMLVAERLHGADRAHALGLAGLGLLVALGTQQVFPLNYGGVLDARPGETMLLLVRNAAMVLLTLWATWRAITVALRVGRSGVD